MSSTAGIPASAPENPKLLTLEQAAAERARLKASGRKLVLTNGVFDLLHAGHIHCLQEARKLGDALFVALNGDASVRALKGPARPIVGETGRACALGSLSCVDGIVLFHTPRADAEIRALQPDIYVKAGDYSLETLNPGERAALEECGAAVRFIPLLPGWSTTGLIERIRSSGL